MLLFHVAVAVASAHRCQALFGAVVGAFPSEAAEPLGWMLMLVFLMMMTTM